MMYVDELIDPNNLGSLLLLIVAVVAIGSYAVGQSSRLRKYGKRLAAATFVAYSVYEWQRLLPATPGEWVGVMFRAGLVAGLALGLFWMLLAMVGFTALELVIAPARFVFGHCRRWKAVWRAERLRREEDRRRRREEESSSRESLVRERMKREREEQATRLAEEGRDARKRRENARLQCDLLYDRHAAELQSVFPRERYEAFLKTYMSDEHPPEFVEERAEQLCRLITDSVGTPAKVQRFGSIKELADHFLTRRKEIETLPYAEDVKDTLLVLVNAKERQAMEQLLS